jgi:hypothetical protein
MIFTSGWFELGSVLLCSPIFIRQRYFAPFLQKAGTLKGRVKIPQHKHGISLRNPWAFVAQNSQARQWLGMQIKYGLAPNTIDAYGRAL